MASALQPIMQEVKRAIFRLPGAGRRLIPPYSPMLETDQLIWLCDAVDRTRAAATGGCIVEVGVARARTSSFLLAHMREHGDKRPYYCIDTLQGFTASDVAYEVEQRGKPAGALTGFAVNDRDLIELGLRRQGFDNVVVVEADAGAFDWSKLPPIDVLLVDVDLYKPSKAVLAASQAFWSHVARVMVYDMRSDTAFDGAHQAYMEFCAERRYSPRLVGTKSGVILPSEQTVPPEEVVGDMREAPVLVSPPFQSVS